MTKIHTAKVCTAEVQIPDFRATKVHAVVKRDINIFHAPPIPRLHPLFQNREMLFVRHTCGS